MKRRLPFIICAIIMTLFIFSNSMDSAEISSAKSSIVTDVICKALNSVNRSPNRSDIVHIVRKTAHVLEFAAQGFLLAFCFDGKFKKRIIYILFFGLFTACCDEYIQLFSSGRGSMVQDVFIDFFGSILGMLFACLADRLTRKG